MTVREYRQSVRGAKRVFASIFLVDGKGARQCRISKVQALQMVNGLKGTDSIKAEWLTDSQEFLMVG